MNPEEIKEQILQLTRQYSEAVHTANRPGTDSCHDPFVPGESSVPYAGRVFTADEVEAAVSSTLDFWLTLGPEGEKFEKELGEALGVRDVILCNSGSSANLLALSALTSSKLGEHRLQIGDEIITAAAGFPTTVAPIVQNQCVPVFVDCDPLTLNARPECIEEAYVPGKTKAVMMAHTLGNPFNLSRVVEFCQKNDLWLIEDNCDALGSTYDGQNTGTFGDLSTQSFYPPHHITLGEGGAVNVVKDRQLKKLVESFRDWGRDCWCPSGMDDTCRKRFEWKLGDLPEGYDHKYIYSHLGYNLKPLDPQAAIGRQQLKKLPDFIKARKDNWLTLRKGLDSVSEFFDFQLPTHAVEWTEEGFKWDESGHRADSSWFGFMMKIRKEAPFSRVELSRYLEDAKIGNRVLFGGNLVKQPAFHDLQDQNPGAIRVSGNLTGADDIMSNSIFVGTYPGLTGSQIQYIIDSVIKFVSCI